MMIRKGFVLLEIVIALFIGSLISGMLFQSLAQSNQIFSKITDISSIARKMALVQQQIEIDFSGICMPPDPVEKKEEVKESENKKEASSDNDKKKLKGFALEFGQEGIIELLSFVTTNPLLTYKQGAPRAVRVAYRIVPDTENEGKLLMVRQQSDELVLEKFQQASRPATRKEDQQPIRSFEIVRNLKSFSCTAFVELIKKQEEKKSWQTPEQKAQEKDKNKKQEQKKDENEEKQKLRSFIVAQEWLGYSDEEKKKFETPSIPMFIKIEVSVVDNFEKIRTFEFWFAAAGGFGFFEREGPTELPSDHELYQRQAADKEDRRIHLHGGIPQP